MKKVIRKSKAKKAKRPDRHQRRVRSIWNRFNQANGNPKATADGKALVEFVREVITPVRERGDQYLNTLTALTDLVPVNDLALNNGPLSNDQLVPKISLELEHLRALRDDRLNYDDMRAALEKLNGMSWFSFLRGKRHVLASSDASNALIGAPVSDAGRMRAALKQADNELTDAVKAIDSEKPAPPDVIMAIWGVIHAARKALTKRQNPGPGSGYKSPPTVVVMPEASPEELAVFFHETYERLAPSFGYETRKDTKAFDPETPNGKLMIAVCQEILERWWSGATASLQGGTISLA